MAALHVYVAVTHVEGGFGIGAELFEHMQRNGRSRLGRKGIDAALYDGEVVGAKVARNEWNNSSVVLVGKDGKCEARAL